GFKLEVTADHSKAFVGEPVQVRMVWTLGKNVHGVQFAIPVDGAQHETMPGPVTHGLRQSAPGSVVVALNGAQALASFDEHSVVIDRVVVPRQAGKITIGPARADYLAVVDRRAPGLMDFPFENRDITERQFSSAAPLEITVEDLPAAGKPSN